MGINNHDFEKPRASLCFVCDQGSERSPRLAQAFKDAGKSAWHYRGGMARLVNEPEQTIKSELGNSFVFLIASGKLPGARERETKTAAILTKLGISYERKSVNDLSTLVRDISNGRVEPRDYGLI